MYPFRYLTHAAYSGEKKGNEWLLFLYETLGVATIGGDLVYDGAARDE